MNPDRAHRTSLQATGANRHDRVIGMPDIAATAEPSIQL